MKNQRSLFTEEEADPSSVVDGHTFGVKVRLEQMEKKNEPKSEERKIS
jgi:hypothetical protein